MIKFEYTETVGWEHAIRGMRNPMNSWEKSDSFIHTSEWELYRFGEGLPEIGPNDYDLMMKLRNAGTDHRKFMRMIDVYVDITAPLYWWKEFDTYKVGTVANSCSTMHKIHAKEFTLEDFSTDHLMMDEDYDHAGYVIGDTINALNYWRALYVSITEDLKKVHFNELEKRKHLVETQKKYWWQMIQLLPSSYNQRRTLKLNYEVLANIYKSRKNHKLDEWREFCKWIEELPYSEIITGCSADDKEE